MKLSIPNPTKDSGHKYADELRGRVEFSRDNSEDVGLYNSTSSDEVNNQKKSLRSQSVNGVLGCAVNNPLNGNESPLRMHDVLGFMREGINIVNTNPIANEKFSFTREAFSQLSPQELVKYFDEQQNINAQVLEIFREVLRRGGAPTIQQTRNESPYQFFKSEASSLGTEQISSLSTEQIKSLEDLVRVDAPSMIILLVDDVYTAMKMLSRQAAVAIGGGNNTPTTSGLPATAVTEWNNKGFVIERKGRCSIICAGNGRIAFDIVKKVPITAMITDMEMPEKNGMELIASVRELELQETRPRMRIALSTAVPKSNLDLQHFDEKNGDCYMLKGENPKAVAEFLAFINTIHEEKISSPAPRTPG